MISSVIRSIGESGGAVTDGGGSSTGLSLPLLIAAAGGEDGVFDFTEFDPKDVLEGEGAVVKMTLSIRKIGSLPIKRPHPDLKDRSLPRSKVTG